LETGLKPGNIVTILPEKDGSLRIFPGLAKGELGPTKCVIDADQCTEPESLTRVIVGCFLIGHDTIQIVSREQLRSDHLEQVRKATQRLSGIGVVEQTLRQVTIQSFVDPTKFAVEGLVRRLHIVVSSMQEAAVKAFLQRNKELAEQTLLMEDEADRIYWLIVRQLVLCARDRGVASKIGVDNPVHIGGYRTLGKELEVMGDCAEAIARETLSLQGKANIDPKLAERISRYNNLVAEISENSAKAMWTKDLKLANSCLEKAKIAKAEQRKLSEYIIREVKDIPLAVALRSVLNNLGMIAYYAQTMAEISMNWVLLGPNLIVKGHIPSEKPPDLARFEKK